MHDMPCSFLFSGSTDSSKLPLRTQILKMSSSTESVIVYITQPLAYEKGTSLLEELNRPHRQLTRSFHSKDPLALSAGNVVGMSVEEVVRGHKEWVEKHDIDPKTNFNGSFMVVADEGTAPASHPRTVLVVNTLEMYGERAVDEQYQAIRVLLSNAVEVISTIEAGTQHKWGDFWQVARLNGGHYPGE